jgi:hypothetical protein
VASSVYSRTLQKAAQLLGSRQKLARHLRVPLAELEKWIAGTALPPTGTFLKAVDLVIIETQAPSGDEPSGGEISDPGDPPAPREGAAVRRSC